VKLLLTAVSGSRQGKTFTVEANECVSFGRTDASTWSFEGDGHMSGIHFEVENLGEHCEVRDRGSTNGTWLNGEKISQTRLREGDRIQAGSTVLTVEFVQPVVPAERSATFSGDSECPGDSDAQEGPIDQAPARSLPPLPTSLPASPPALAPLPNTDRVAAPKPINPFDSIDFSSSVGIPKDQLEAGHATPAFPLDNPIPASGLSISRQDQQESIAANKSAHRHQAMQRQTTQNAADSFTVILDSLAKKWSIQLVLHFQKVRTIPPLPPQVMHPLFSWLSDTEAAPYSPIRVAWNDVISGDSVLPLIPRLCRADGCVAFLGRTAVEIETQIDLMIDLGVEGFSEEGGFLPTCWPSSLAAIIDSAGLDVCEPLFGGKISGVLMCSASDHTHVKAVADAQLAEDLSAKEFFPAERIVGA